MIPGADSAEKAPPGDTVVDPLQRDVDLKLLVSSKGKSPSTCRKNLQQKSQKAKVNVHKIIFVHVLGQPWCEHAESVCTHTHCAETLCISTASTGVGTSWRQESSFCIPHCRRLAPASSSMRPGQVCQETRYTLFQIFLKFFSNFFSNYFNFSKEVLEIS